MGEVIEVECPECGHDEAEVLDDPAFGEVEVQCLDCDHTWLIQTD